MAIFGNALWGSNGALTNNQFTQLFNLAQQYADDAKVDAELTRQREDTAVQRLVADYKAAGLNPWLIGGSTTGAQTSQVNPSLDRLNSLIATFDNYLNYANNVRQYFGTGSQIMNETGSNLLKFGNLITRLVGMSVSGF